MTLDRLMALHAARYPLMREGDWLKLLYQASFGPGHFVPDPAKALIRLQDEITALPVLAPGPLTEPVGHGIFRLYLAPALREGLRPQTIAALFCRAARVAAPDPARFAADAAALIDRSRRGALDADPETLGRLLRECEEAGWAPFSHTAAYRAAYAPAYRLIDAAGERYIRLFCAIDRLLARQGRARVVIDGCCASGKTTLSNLLEEIYDAQVLHMDDYFLPFERKTPERLAQPGGNVDYERFSAEIGDHLDDRMLIYRPYDCHRGELAEEVVSVRKSVQVVEGVYSLRPGLVPACDISVFMRVNRDEQLRRLRGRGGEALLRRFVNEWIPMEERYFDAFGVSAACDMIYTE